MFFSQINYLLVVIAGILNIGLGFLWYIFLFAKPWMRLMNLTPEKMKEQNDSVGINYIISFVLSLISAAVYQSVFVAMSPTSLVEALLLAFFVWLGFVFFVMVNQGMFAKKPFKLVLIDAGYYLASLILWSLLFHYFE